MLFCMYVFVCFFFAFVVVCFVIFFVSLVATKLKQRKINVDTFQN